MISRKSQPDIAIALVLTVLFFFLYAQFGLRLAQGVYFDYLNLAFDFDPPYFIDFLVGSLPSGVNYKHPLSRLFRPFASLFLVFGFEPKAAAVLVMALFGSLTVTLVYVFSCLANFGRPQAFAATLFFGASSTPLFTSIIVESYGWASFSIVLIWCVFMLGQRAKSVPVTAPLLAAVLVAGVTITNIMHSLVAELFSQLRTGGPKNAFIRTILFGIFAGLALFVVLAVLQPLDLWNVIVRPVETAKEIYWLRTKGDVAGPSELLLTFFGYSFFSPEFARVEIGPDVFMSDFRTFSYDSIERLFVIVWWVFAAAGAAMGFRHPQFRRVAMPLALILIINLLFHLDYQYRGSLYLYAAHLHFPIFALGMGAAPWVASQSLRIRVGYVTVLLTLAVAALAINLQRASDFVVMFDTVPFPADAAAINR
jgi:hypothetical protein